MLADIVGRIALQVWGFIGCAVGLFLASLSGFFADGEQLLLIFAGFMLFNFMTNLGPNARRPILLAGEVFPTAIRGKGAGFRRRFRQDRRRDDRVPVPRPFGQYRHAGSALLPYRDVAARRRDNLALPNRDEFGVSLREPAWRDPMTGAIRATEPCKGKAA